METKDIYPFVNVDKPTEANLKAREMGPYTVDSRGVAGFYSKSLLPPSASSVARAAHEVAAKMGWNEQALSDLQTFLTPTRVTLSERHLKIFTQEVERKRADVLAICSWQCEDRADVNDREQTPYCF